nr:hypothetical protein [uncultured Carboxylicivirga sp.]
MSKTKDFKLIPSIIIYILLITFGTLSCVNNNGSKKLTQEEENHKAVVIKANDTTIDSENYKIVSKLLYGKWKESIVWIKNSEATRTGIRFIVMTSEYEFQSNGHYSYKRFLRDSITDFYAGKFKLLDGGNKIEMTSNLRNDFEFKDGDTVQWSIREFHLLTDSILRLEEDSLSCQRGTIVEYKRK